MCGLELGPISKPASFSLTPLNQKRALNMLRTPFLVRIDIYGYNFS